MENQTTKKSTMIHKENEWEWKFVGIWADMIKDYLPKERLDIKFKVIDENTRVLILKPYGEEYTRICEDIL